MPAAAGAVPGPFPALWRPDPLDAAGGRPDKRILELFAYEGIEASRFISAAADYVDWTAQDFDPCPPLSQPEPVCYRFDAEPLGFIESERHVTTGGDARVLLCRRSARHSSPKVSAATSRTLRLRAEVVASPIAGLAQRLIRLPATNGTTPPVAAGDRLRLRFQRAEEATVLVLRYPGGIVRMRGYLLDTLVADVADGVFSGHLGEDRFEVVDLHDQGPARPHRDRSGARPGPALAAVAGPAGVPALHLRRRAVAGPAGRRIQLEPVLVRPPVAGCGRVERAGAQAGHALHARDQVELAARARGRHARQLNATTDTFSFTTTASPPATLRGPAAGLDATDWEVKTLPVDGDDAVYTSRPIRLEFRDARTDKVYAAFGQRLALRFVDEHGDDLFDRLDFLRENATDLPEYQRAWRDHVLDATVRAAGPRDAVGERRRAFRQRARQRRALRGDAGHAAGDRHGSVDGRRLDAVPGRVPLRLPHLALCFVVRACRGARAVRRVLRAGPRSDRAVRRARLAGGRHPARGRSAARRRHANHLRLLPREAAAQPELVRVWRRSPGDPAHVDLIALLIDGPEALLRTDTCVLAV